MEVIANSKNYQKISEKLGYKPFYFTFDDKYMLYPSKLLSISDSK